MKMVRSGCLSFKLNASLSQQENSTQVTIQVTGWEFPR